MIRLASIALILASAVCAMPAATKANVPGRYRSVYGDGAEDVEIRGDGTFTQTIRVEGKEYTTTGKWLIERAPSGYDFIKFTPFSTSYTPVFKKMFIPPEKSAEGAGMWVSDGKGDDRIVFEDEPEYAIVKRK